MDRTWKFIEQAYITLQRVIFSKNIGTKQISGPVAIAMVSYNFAKEGLVDLLYFLALISANLAVINFLPLPIVDGGLFVFLIVEKIKRKPVSVRTMQISQIIGIVLIVSLVLLVTWQDIVRFFLTRR